MKTRNKSILSLKDSNKNKSLSKAKKTKIIRSKETMKDASYRDQHNIGRRKSTSSVVTYSLDSRLFFDVYAKFNNENLPKDRNIYNGLYNNSSPVKINTDKKSPDSKTKPLTIITSKRQISSESGSDRDSIDIDSETSRKPKIIKVSYEAKPINSDEACIPSPQIPSGSPIKNNNKLNKSYHSSDNRIISTRNSKSTSMVNDKSVKNEVQSKPTTKNETFQRLLDNKTVFKKHLSQSITNKNKSKRKIIQPVLSPSSPSSTRRLSSRLNKSMNDTDSVLQSSDEHNISPIKHKNSKRSEKSKEICVDLDLSPPKRGKRIASLNAAAIINCVQNLFNESPKRSPTKSNRQRTSKLDDNQSSSTKDNEVKTENAILVNNKNYSIITFEDIPMKVKADEENDDEKVSLISNSHKKEDNKKVSLQKPREKILKKTVERIVEKVEDNSTKNLEEKPLTRGDDKSLKKIEEKSLNKTEENSIKNCEEKSVKKIGDDNKQPKKVEGKVLNKIDDSTKNGEEKLIRKGGNDNKQPRKVEEKSVKKIEEKPMKKVEENSIKICEEKPIKKGEDDNKQLKKSEENLKKKGEDDNKQLKKSEENQKKKGEDDNKQLKKSEDKSVKKNEEKPAKLVEKEKSIENHIAGKSKEVEVKRSSSLLMKSQKKNNNNIARFFDITTKNNCKQKDVGLGQMNVKKPKTFTVERVVKKKLKNVDECFEEVLKTTVQGGKKGKKQHEDKKQVSMPIEEEDDNGESLWEWEGESYKKSIQLQIAGEIVERTCYNSIRHSRDDIVVRTFDCVMLRSSADQEPFLAKIIVFYLDEETGKKMMTLLWYYRPEHTEQGRLDWHTESDVYASRHLDNNSVDCIEDKAFVLPVEIYSRFMAYQKRQSAGTRPSLAARLIPVNNDDAIISEPDENKLDSCTDMFISSWYYTLNFQNSFPAEMTNSNVFVCRGLYDINQHKITRNILQNIQSPKLELIDPCESIDSAMSISSCESEHKEEAIVSLNEIETPLSDIPIPPTKIETILNNCLPPISSFQHRLPKPQTDTVVPVAKSCPPPPPSKPIQPPLPNSTNGNCPEHLNGHP